MYVVFHTCRLGDGITSARRLLCAGCLFGIQLYGTVLNARGFPFCEIYV